MLKRLTLRNFRAFKSQDFDFSKINVFVGPNNSGKSSAISALNLLSQTINSPELDQSPLVLNGAFDTLGTFIDLVHGGRSNTPMGFDLAFSDFTVKMDYKFRQQRREIELVKYELLEHNRQLLSYTTRKDAFDFRVGSQPFDRLAPGSRKRRPQFRGLLPSAALFTPYRFAREGQELTEDARSKIVRTERSVIRARSALRRLFDEFDSKQRSASAQRAVIPPESFPVMHHGGAPRVRTLALKSRAGSK
jgi:hypothetical protein